MAPISCEVSSLGRLIRGERAFVIPQFQRNYAWGEEHVESFWRDIFGIFADTGRDYFLGAITLKQLDSDDPIVIDGQQRLITTSVLVAALRSVLAEAGDSELGDRLFRELLLVDGEGSAEAPLPRIVLNSADRRFYEDHIIGGTSLRDMRGFRRDDSLPQSNRLLADCFCFMHRQLGAFLDEGWTGPDLFSAVSTAINENVYVIRLDVRSDYDAFALFESLNDRGMRLSEADLLKNHLLAAAGTRQKDAQADWEAVEGNLGGDRLLKFVRHHWHSSRGKTSRAGLYPDIKRFVSTADSAANYAEELCSASGYYAALRDPGNATWARFGPENQRWIHHRLECISLLRTEQVFIVLLAALETDHDSFPGLLDTLNSFTFRYTMSNVSTSSLLPAFISAAQHIRETGTADRNEVFDRFLASFYPSDSQFHSAFSRRTIRNNALARHILTRLNEEIGSHSDAEADTAAHFTDLEHILPKRFQRNWRATRRDFPGGPEKYVHRLGNMTLLAVELNRELGNQPFEAKRDVFAEDPLEITRMVAEEPRWTAETIARRQNWMAGLATRIWQCP